MTAPLKLVPLDDPVSLRDVELAAADYRSARDDLGEHIGALEEAMTALKRAALPTIRAAVHAAAAAEDTLRALVAANPANWQKPRTRVFSGVRVGYRDQPGKLVVADEADAIRKVRKLLPEQEGVLIAVRETLVRAALAKLDAKTLARLGVSVEDAGDQLIIKPVDSEIDKLVDALLKGAADEGVGEEGA